MLTVHGREILMVACVGFSISIIIGFFAMAIAGACKMRKAQQAASGCRAPPRSNGGGGEDRLPSTAATAAAQVMPLLCRYLKADGWQDATCGVCLAELTDGDALRVLPPCMHYFHAACVGDWLRLHATCPFCRGPVAAARPPA